MDGSNAGFYAPGPPLMNPPPRIFGNMHPNGSPIPPSLAGPLFAADDLDDVHDQGDPKRRRIARVGGSSLL